jgi:hypothetical protein
MKNEHLTQACLISESAPLSCCALRTATFALMVSLIASQKASEQLLLVAPNGNSRRGEVRPVRVGSHEHASKCLESFDETSELQKRYKEL